MYDLISELILYSDLGKGSVLEDLADAISQWERGLSSKTEIKRQIHSDIKKILDLSTAYGFDKNLWHCYLTWLLITNENSFSLTCEGAGAKEDASVNSFAEHDFKIFKKLFDYDFSPLERDLGMDCFSLIENYHAIPKTDNVYDKEVSINVRALSEKIAASRDEKEIFKIVTEFYKNYGVGMFGLHRAFRFKETPAGIEFIPIINADTVRLSDLVGYKRQKEELCRNTLAFCQGKKANNVLLYGDAGTGKSTSIKAVLNEYAPMGLRMIEVYKYQFCSLSDIIAALKKRNYKFIIYIDDLSFEENEADYKFLKAVIEGGVENRPDNILIYATSNRRHLVKETWKDKNDMEYNEDVHSSETMEEKLSLAARFGVSINYPSPRKQEFNEIVISLARRAGLTMSDEELLYEANRWEIRKGSLSGRTAEQFINYLLGK